MSSEAKLYLVTRADLRHGSQAAQLVHGMATFAREHHARFLEWERLSNTVVCLAVPDKRALEKLLHDARQIGLILSFFSEPDFDDELTCVVLEPGAFNSQELCRGLPLACR